MWSTLQRSGKRVYVVRLSFMMQLHCEKERIHDATSKRIQYSLTKTTKALKSGGCLIIIHKINIRGNTIKNEKNKRMFIKYRYQL